MTKKLYTVVVTYEYAVLAEDEQEAISFKKDAFDDGGEPGTDAFLTVQSVTQVCRPSGWEDRSLVYGAPRDTEISLGDAVASAITECEAEAKKAVFDSQQTSMFSVAEDP